MLGILILIIGGLMMLRGIHYLSSDLTDLWASFESSRRAQGVVSLQRTPEWERSTRSSGRMLTAAAALILCFGWLVTAANVQRARWQHDMVRDHYYIDGKKISEEEAERTGLKGIIESQRKP